MHKYCTFAAAGTFGHECGAPATVSGIKPSIHVKGGVFYAYRCVKHREVKGGENAQVIRWEPVSPEHVNLWK